MQDEDELLLEALGARGGGGARFAAKRLKKDVHEIELRLPPVEHMPRENVGAALVHHFFERWEQDEVLTALLRVGVTNAAGTQRVQRIFREQVAPVVAVLCPDPAQASTRAALVASQILGVALSRYVLKIPPAVGMSRAELVAWMGPTVQRYLTAESP